MAASLLPHSGHIPTTSKSLPLAALGANLVSEIMNLSLRASCAQPLHQGASRAK